MVVLHVLIFKCIDIYILFDCYIIIDFYTYLNELTATGWSCGVVHEKSLNKTHFVKETNLT